MDLNEFSDDTIIRMAEALQEKLVETVVTQLNLGSSNADLLTEDAALSLMKSSTMLVSYNALVRAAILDKDYATARKILTAWSTTGVQLLASMAFEEEIESAKNNISKGVDELEKFANQERK